MTFVVLSLQYVVYARCHDINLLHFTSDAKQYCYHFLWCSQYIL